METLSREELIQRISNPDTDWSEITPYLTLQKDPAHGVIVDADTDHLKVDEDRDNPLTEANVAFGWIVKALRQRRKRQFERSMEKRSDDHPIVLLDGDSWAQHPFVDEIYDQLTDTHNVYCSSLAGRTMQELHDENCYIHMLQDLKGRGAEHRIRAIILSGGGNDLFGKKLGQVLKPFDAAQPQNPQAHINESIYDGLVQAMVDLYSEVIRKIRLLHTNSPIILHTYCYLTPWDVRNGVIPKDAWVGDPMRDKGINDLNLQKAIVKHMVDHFHSRLATMVDSRDSSDDVILMDNRELLSDARSLWSDEIHPSSEGFSQVGQRIKELLVPVPA